MNNLQDLIAHLRARAVAKHGEELTAKLLDRKQEALDGSGVEKNSFEEHAEHLVEFGLLDLAPDAQRFMLWLDGNVELWTSQMMQEAELMSRSKYWKKFKAAEVA